MNKAVHYLKLLPNVLYAELLSIFDCSTTFMSLPVQSSFEELFHRRIFLTLSQSCDNLNTDDVRRIY